MYFNFSISYIVNSRTNLARKISAKASRNFSSAYKFFYMLCKTMVFLAHFPQKKRRKPFVYGLSPLRQYKDNTFLREMQIHLTYRNSLRNVKRRVLHNLAFAMYYITRLGSQRANGRCSTLVSTAALQPSFNGSLRLPSFSRGLRPLVSTQPYGCQLDSIDSLQVGSIYQPYGFWLDSVDSLLVGSINQIGLP